MTYTRFLTVRCLLYNFNFKLIQTTPDFIYGINHLLGLKLLIRLRLRLSHLSGHRMNV